MNLDQNISITVTKLHFFFLNAKSVSLGLRLKCELILMGGNKSFIVRKSSPPWDNKDGKGSSYLIKCRKVI